MEHISNTWFPMYVNLDQKKILIIGGGTIAERRINTLLSFHTQMVCVAPDVTERIRNLSERGFLHWEARSFETKELAGCDAWCVLACTDQQEFNHRIAQICREHRILVNNCADQSDCDFYFPAIVRTDDDLVIGINAGGSNHRAVRKMRERIQKDLEN